MLLAAFMLAMVAAVHVAPIAAVCVEMAGVTCTDPLPNAGCCDASGDCAKDLLPGAIVTCGPGLDLACCT